MALKTATDLATLVKAKAAKAKAKAKASAAKAKAKAKASAAKAKAKAVAREKRAGLKTFAAYDKKFGTKAIAQATDTKAGTVRGWRSRGIPTDQLAKLAVLDSVRVSPAKEQKALLKLSKSSLATILGVTSRTAAKWQKDGKIPQKMVHRVLLDRLHAHFPRRLKGTSEEIPAIKGDLKGVSETVSGKRKAGLKYELEVDAPVSKALIFKVIQWADREITDYLSDSPSVTWWFVCDAEITVKDPDEDLPFNIYDSVWKKDANGNFFTHSKAIPTTAQYSKTEAIKELYTLLLQMRGYEVHLIGVTAFVRDWKVGVRRVEQ